MILKFLPRARHTDLEIKAIVIQPNPELLQTSEIRVNYSDLMMFDWTFLKEKYISYIIFSIKKIKTLKYGILHL